MTASAGRGARLPARLNDLALLAMMGVLAAILTLAMILQFAGGEVPCPLCLLQRVAMFGVCFGIVLHFSRGYSTSNTGLCLLFAMFLLIVSVRQTLLNIYPRPGHSWVGSAVLGLHMPVWSVIIALAILLAFALDLAVLGSERLRGVAPTPMMTRLAGWTSLYVIVLCLLNLVAVILQCGIGECHTTGYDGLSRQSGPAISRPGELAGTER